MAISSAIMLGGALLGQGFGSLFEGIGDSYSQKAQADFQAKIYESNAKLSDVSYQDAIDRGEEAVSAHRMATRKFLGDQRVQLAAQGIDITSGSARKIQEDTRLLSKIDEIRITNNAYREAWGYKIEAIQANASGQFVRTAGAANAQSTLLTGISGFGSSMLRAGSAFADATTARSNPKKPIG